MEPPGITNAVGRKAMASTPHTGPLDPDNNKANAKLRRKAQMNERMARPVCKWDIEIF